MFRKFGKMGLGASVGKSVPIEVLPKTKPMTFEIITRPYVLGLFEGTVELYKGTFEDISGADYSDMEVVSEELVATQQLQAYPNYAPLTFQIPATDDYDVYFIKIKNLTPNVAFSDIKFTYDEYVLCEVGSVDRLGFDENGQPIHHSSYNKFDITGYIKYETTYKIVDEEGNLLTDRKYVGYYSNSNDDENKIFFFDGERINDGDYNNPGYLKNKKDYVIKLPYYKSATDYDLTKVVIRKYLEPIDIEDMYWSGSYLPKNYESQMTVYAPPGYTYEVKYSANSRLDFEAPTSVLIPTKPMKFDFISRPYTRGLVQATIELYKGTWDEANNLLSEEFAGKTATLKPYPDYAPVVFDIPKDDNYNDYFIKIKNIGTSATYAECDFYSYLDYQPPKLETSSEDIMIFGDTISSLTHNLKAENIIDLSYYLVYKTTLTIVDSDGNKLNDRVFSAQAIDNRGNIGYLFFDFWKDERIGDELQENICCLTDLQIYNTSAFNENNKFDPVKILYYKINKHVSTVIPAMGNAPDLLPEVESSMIVRVKPGFNYNIEFTPDADITLDCPISVLIPPSTTD